MAEETSIESPDSTQDERTRRALIGVAVLVGIIVLVLWLLWMRTAIVPDVSGMTEPQARISIEEAGFEVGEVKLDASAISPTGTVDDQGLPAGTRAFRGSDIDLFVSAAVGEVPDDTRVGNLFDPDGYDGGSDIRGRGAAGTEGDVRAPRSYVGVPEVLNMSEAAAVRSLRGAGLGVRVVRAPSSSGVAAGRIFYQTPSPNEDPNGPVEIWVSTGPPPMGGQSFPEPNKPAGR